MDCCGDSASCVGGSFCCCRDVPWRVSTMAGSVTVGVGSVFCCRDVLQRVSTIVGSVTSGVGSGVTIAGSVAVGVGSVAGVGTSFFGAGSCTRFLMDGLGLTMASGETNPMEDFTGVRVSTIPCIGADRLGFSALPWLPRECYLRAFLLFYPNVVGIDLH